MKRRKVDAGLERQFLISLITSRPFLSAAAGMIDVELFPSKYVQLLARWSIDYWKEFGEPPGKTIQGIYQVWVEKESPEDSEQNAVHDFLESISAEYDVAQPTNPPFLISELSKYLTTRKIKSLNTILDSAPSEEAISAITSFRMVTPIRNNIYDPNRSKDAIRRAWVDNREPVIEMSGDAGKFFNSALVRDSLIAIQGPEKRGKTAWLFEFMYWAIRGGRRAILFEVGDLSDSQLMTRMSILQCQIPLWPSQCKGLSWPISISLDKDSDGNTDPSVEFATRVFPEPLSENLASIGQDKFAKLHKLHPVKSHTLFSIHANSTINVRGIHDELKMCQHELEFVPDVILIDYADILAPEDRKQIDNRERVNETWKALRRLSQDWHACVIVPTQANAASYTAKTQTMANFSNDKRKNSHVTAIIGLNQTPEEKEIGVMRLNWLNKRESEYDVNQFLYTAGCPALNRMMVKSVLGKRS